MRHHIHTRTHIIPSVCVCDVWVYASSPELHSLKNSFHLWNEGRWREFRRSEGGRARELEEVSEGGKGREGEKLLCACLFLLWGIVCHLSALSTAAVCWIVISDTERGGTVFTVTLLKWSSRVGREEALRDGGTMGRRWPGVRGPPAAPRWSPGSSRWSPVGPRCVRGRIAISSPCHRVSNSNFRQ